MNVFELSASLELNTQDYERSLATAKQAGQNFERNSGGIADATRKMTGGFTVLKGVISNVIGNGINALAGSISNNLQNAISRTDILNNYGVVMENLGHDADAAKQEVTRLADGIDGLPTTLDSIASTQQQFAALGMSMKEATDLSLALNNATLAGGQGQVKANGAMQQWYQMIAAGKSDLMSMRIINEAMPAQMDAIAKSVVGANANWQDLHAEWQKNPEITKKVQDAILELNEKGAEGTKSFAKQAKDATKGIETSMQNVQSAFSRGIANVLNTIGKDTIAEGFTKIKDAVDSTFTAINGYIEIFKESGLGSVLANMLIDVNNVLEDFFANLNIGDRITQTFEFIRTTFEVIKPKLFQAIETILHNLPESILTFLSYVVEGMAQGLPVAMEALMQVANHLVEGFVNAFLSVKDRMPEVMGNIVDGIGDTIVNFVEGLPDLLNNLADFFDAFGDAIYGGASTASNKVPELVEKIAKVLWENKEPLAQAGLKLGGALIRFILKGVISQVMFPWKLFGWLWDELWKAVGNFGKKVEKIGGQIVRGIWKGISDGYEWIKGKITSWVGNVVDFIKKVLGIESPSKVMAKEVGKWIPAGIAKGILDNEGVIDDAMEDLIPDPNIDTNVVLNAKTDGEISGGVMGEQGKVVNINTYVNVDGATESPEDYAMRLASSISQRLRTV